MKNISKKLITLGLSAVMTCSMSVTAFAAEGDFTGDTMTGTADKYYTVSSDPTYTDVSAVKLTWKVPVLTYTSGSNKAWNTSTLRWESTAYADTTGDEVSFTLANRSSYVVKGTASFALADGLDAAAASVAFTGNEVTIDSIVDGSTHKLKNEGTETDSEAYITANCTKTIIGKVTPDWEKLTNTAKTKLGTYTVTLTDPNAPTRVIAATFSKDGVTEELTWDELKDSANGTKYEYSADFISDTSIDQGAFSGCNSLTTVSIPGSVTSIGESAFGSCEYLTSVTLGSGVKTIGENAFGGTGLVSIVIPDSVTTIGDYAFSQCGSLANATIGSGVTSIGKNAFEYTNWEFNTITYNGTIEQWNSISKEDTWYWYSGITVIHCTDGDVTLVEEDS